MRIRCLTSQMRGNSETNIVVIIDHIGVRKKLHIPTLAWRVRCNAGHGEATNATNRMRNAKPGCCHDSLRVDTKLTKFFRMLFPGWHATSRQQHMSHLPHRVDIPGSYQQAVAWHWIRLLIKCLLSAHRIIPWPVQSWPWQPKHPSIAEEITNGRLCWDTAPVNNCTDGIRDALEIFQTLRFGVANSRGGVNGASKGMHDEIIPCKDPDRHIRNRMYTCHSQLCGDFTKSNWLSPIFSKRGFPLSGFTN